MVYVRGKFGVDILKDREDDLVLEAAKIEKPC